VGWSIRDQVAPLATKSPSDLDEHSETRVSASAFEMRNPVLSDARFFGQLALSQTQQLALLFEFRCEGIIGHAPTTTTARLSRQGPVNFGSTCDLDSMAVSCSISATAFFFSASAISISARFSTSRTGAFAAL
jgi:hypothetical protein